MFDFFAWTARKSQNTMECLVIKKQIRILLLISWSCVVLEDSYYVALFVMSQLKIAYASGSLELCEIQACGFCLLYKDEVHR